MPPQQSSSTGTGSYGGGYGGRYDSPTHGGQQQTRPKFSSAFAPSLEDRQRPVKTPPGPPPGAYDVQPKWNKVGAPVMAPLIGSTNKRVEKLPGYVLRAYFLYYACINCACNICLCAAIYKLFTGFGGEFYVYCTYKTFIKQTDTTNIQAWAVQPGAEKRQELAQPEEHHAQLQQERGVAEAQCGARARRIRRRASGGRDAAALS